MLKLVINAKIMEILHKSLTFGISLVLATLAIAGGIEFSYKTVDDSKLVQNYLYSQPNSKVLGASSKKSDVQKCPETSPIIGWIDFRGKKLIKENLPADLSASSCFKNLDEAHEAGFYE
jgi:hypothetical protein